MVASPSRGVFPWHLPCSSPDTRVGPVLSPAQTWSSSRPGSTVYTCMLNTRGGTESDLTVSRLAPGPEAMPLAPAFEGKCCPLGHSNAVTTALLW